MARIRTIKPDFFRHAALFDAEQESGMSLRLAFAGLWTAADREGRFKWQPRQIKLDCLPYDNVDFGLVLNALVEHGFIRKYEIDGEEYGYIPAWNKHQHVNLREAQSSIPEPTEEGILNAEACMCSNVHAHGEGKGKEGKGREGELIIRAVAEATRPDENIFEEFWKSYPKREGANPKKPARKAFFAALKERHEPERIIAGAGKYREECRRLKQEGTQFVTQAVTWLHQERWADYQIPPPSNDTPAYLKPPPGCRPYAEIMAEMNGVKPHAEVIGTEVRSDPGVGEDGGDMPEKLRLSG